MNLKCFRYTLELRNQFTIAGSSRRTTPSLIIELEHNGIIGYGEASMPPYLGETQDSAKAFLNQLDLSKYDHLSIDILKDIEAFAPGNTAAKAAFDIALHDLIGKLTNTSCFTLWNATLKKIPPTSYTIGIGNKESVQNSVSSAAGYKILKVKLGGENDHRMIEWIREYSTIPIRVDCNQGWLHRDKALQSIEWLAKQGVELIEQPMPKERVDDIAWLRERSPIPIVADEAIQRIQDIPHALGIYDGINIKLMKCTGLNEAYRMISLAREYGLKVMIGCMTETSCAISAASHLASLADWVDLDGAALISNDPFDGAVIINGILTVPEKPGIGVEPNAIWKNQHSG